MLQNFSFLEGIRKNKEQRKSDLIFPTDLRSQGKILRDNSLTLNTNNSFIYVFTLFF